MFASHQFLCLAFTAQVSYVSAGEDLRINAEYLPTLFKQPSKADDWKLMRVELMYKGFLKGEKEPPHFAVRITTDQPIRTDGYDNPILYDLRTAPDNNNFESISGYPTNDRWPGLNRVASTKGPFPEKRDDETSKDITFERLFECVGSEGLRKVPGKCLFFALRVIRFIVGECNCGACGNQEMEKVEKVQNLSVEAQARVDGDKVGLTILVNAINVMKKEASTNCLMMLYVMIHPFQYSDIKQKKRCLAASDIIIDQLYSIAGVKRDMKTN